MEGAAQLDLHGVGKLWAGRKAEAQEHLQPTRGWEHRQALLQRGWTREAGPVQECPQGPCEPAVLVS